MHADPSTAIDMKIVLFSLLLCVAGICAYKRNHEENEKLKLQCSANYGINLTEIIEKHMPTAEAIELITPYKMGCIVACYLKKALEGESTTVVEYIQKAMSTSPYFLGLISDEEQPKYTKISNDCITEAKGDDCEVMKCLKAWQKPFNSFLLLP